jgi:hypothetical protein
MSPRLRRFVERAALAAAILFVVVVLPLPFWTPRWFELFQVPVAVMLFIMYLGKLLYDTLFYDRYQ